MRIGHARGFLPVEIDRIISGADGAFSFVGFVGHSDTPRTLSAISDPDGDAVEADRLFVLAANPAPVQVAVVDAVIPESVNEPESVVEPVDIAAVVAMLSLLLLLPHSFLAARLQL